MKALCLPHVNNLFFSKLCEGLDNFTEELSFDPNALWTNPFRFDILHIHFPEAFYCWDRYKLCTDESKSMRKFLERLKQLRLKGVKILWTVHNLEPHDRTDSDMDRNFFKNFIRHCDAIIVQCRTGEKLLKEKYPLSREKYIRVIPHINYIDCYPNNVSRQEARKILGYSKSDFLFLSFGLIRPYKNIPLLIKAFRKISRNMSRTRLLIAGAFSEDMNLKARSGIFLSTAASSRIKLKTEYIKDSDVQTYFNAADVSVFSYRKIFMSGAVILAQSFALPVIAPDDGCIPDYVPPGTGFLYRRSDADDLAAKMAQAGSSDLTVMGKNAKQLQQRNRYLAVAEKTFEVYRKLIEGNH